MVNPTSPGSPRTPSRMASRGIPAILRDDVQFSQEVVNRTQSAISALRLFFLHLLGLRRAGLDTGGQAIKSLGLPPTRDWQADITSMRYSLIAITAHPVVSSGNAQRDVLSAELTG